MEVQKIPKRTVTLIEPKKSILVDLSLIHISEPTRPY